MGANAANDIIDIEIVVGLVEHGLVVNADDENAVVAHHQRDALKVVGELPADRLFDRECAVKKATRDTVFDLDRRHTDKTNGGCKSYGLLLERRVVALLAFVDPAEGVPKLVVGELLKDLVHLGFQLIDPGFELVEPLVVDLGR